jgi:hypothetical protein
MDVLVRSGAYERFGEATVLGSFRQAAIRAWEVLDEMPPSALDGSPGAGSTPDA